MADEKNVNPSQKDSEKVGELKVKLNEVQSLLDLWDEIRTNPDGSINEPVDAQIKIIAFGEEIINSLAPDLPIPQRRTIIEKLELAVKEKYQQTDQNKKTYYQYVCTLSGDPQVKEELQKRIQSWIKAD